MRAHFRQIVFSALPMFLIGPVLAASDAATDKGVRPTGKWLVWKPWRAEFAAKDPVATIRGEAMALAWAAADSGGRTRVRVVSSSGGLPVVGGAATIQNAPEGEEHSPAIALSPDATRLGVAWVTTSPERDLLCFVESGDITGEARVPFIISATGDAVIEPPTISWIDDTTPIVAWTESTGSSSSVYTGWRFGDEWQVRRASIGEHPFDLAPSLLSEPSPALWYYSFDGSDVTLRSTQLGLWGLAREGTNIVHPSPADRLPILFDAGVALLPGATWLEPVEGGDALLTFDPLRPLEESIRVEAGATGSRILDPAVDGRSLAWIEERDDLRRVHVRTARGERESIPAGIAARHLRISSDAEVMLAVWVEEPKDGGNGSLTAAVRRERPVP